jgi:hypothetical protein
VTDFHILRGAFGFWSTLSLSLSRLTRIVYFAVVVFDWLGNLETRVCDYVQKWKASLLPSSVSLAKLVSMS